MFSSYHIEENWEKRFLAAATFEGLWDVFFLDRLRKLIVCLDLYEPSLHFCRREHQINTVYER